MTFVLWLHVLTAIIAIGPLVAVTSAAPRAIDAGSVEVLRWMTRTTRVYTIASIVVFLLGLALVPLGDHGYGFGQFWISSSMTLYIVAVALLAALVQRDLGKAVAHLAAGEPADMQRGRVLGVGIAVNIIWLVIVLLMVYRPGA